MMILWKFLYYNYAASGYNYYHKIIGTNHKPVKI